VGPDSALIRRAKEGDRAAVEQMIQENQGLIWSIARRFFGRGTEPDDLYQIGCLGFIKAIRGYDESFGTQFSTYAVPKIMGEIRRFLRDDGSVKISRPVKARASQLRQSRERLEAVLDREPTLSELSEESGVPMEDIAMLENVSSPVDSLQREMQNGGQMIDLMGDDGMEEQLIEKISVRQAVEQLPEKEKMVIKLRFYHNITQEGAARVLGVSQVQISRLERRAVDSLREIMRVL